MDIQEKLKRIITDAYGPQENKKPADTEVIPAPVAIIGVAANLPQSPCAEDFWQALAQERSLIEPLGNERFISPQTDQSYHAGLLQDIKGFDYRFFDFSAAGAQMMDPRQRLLLMSVQHCLEDAGYAPESLKQSDTGVFMAAEENQYIQSLTEQNVSLADAMGHSASMIANRISYFFDWRGPSESVNTMCSGAAVAIHRAVNALRSGEISQAICGAANLLIRPETF